MTDIRPLNPQSVQTLEELYRRHSDWLARRLRRHVEPDRAREFVQEAYLRAAPLDANQIRHPRAFLLRVALNLVRDDARKRQRQTITAERIRQLEPRGLEASQIDQVMLKQVVLGMPALYRDVFLLSRFRGLSHAEIGTRLGISPKTVEWRLARAMEYCLSRLDP